MPRTVVCLSGGLDSTVLAAHLQARGHDVLAVAYSYGQRHERAELFAARNVASHLRLSLDILSLHGVTSRMNPASSQLLAANPAPHVPQGHYAEASMRATVVPGRNLLMIAAATAYAASHDATAVALAAHGGDHPIYPDCRPTFLIAASEATRAGYGITLLFPFAEKTKADITALGHTLDAPLAKTWSCYNGQDRHCGKCGTCVERAEAFHLAAVTDPTDYADPDFWRTTTQNPTP